MARPRKEVRFTKEEMTQYLRTNDKMLYEALMKLYSCQLYDEQEVENAIYKNRKGFAKPDAKMLTVMAKRYLADGDLNFADTQLVRNKLVKRYTVQITKLANADVLSFSLI